MTHLALYALIAAVFLLAGAVKGVLGMGLPTVAIALLGVLVTPVQAAALLVVPSFVTNVWQFVSGPAARGVFMRFAPMMFGIALGTPLGIGLLTRGDGMGVSAMLGTALAVYAVAGLASPRFAVAPRHEPWLSPLAGLLTGAVTGATGVFVIPAVPYLSALQLERDELLQALGLSFTVSTLALAVALAASGRFGAPLAGASALALLPALGGMYLGARARRRMHPLLFRRCFFAGLFLLGFYMVVRAFVRSQS